MANLARCSVFILILLCAVPVLVAQVETFIVVRVVDGDTCTLENGERVRYLGINAPERNEPQFQEATEANSDLVAGKEVRLELGKPSRDEYDRILAYLFVDGVFVNQELVRQGYAHIQRPLVRKYTEILLEAQEEARKKGLGIWIKVPGRNLTIIQVHANAEGDDRYNLCDEYIIIENKGDSPVDMNGWTVSDETSRTPYLFAYFVLEPQAKLTLTTGTGKSTPNQLFWGSRSPIWNNDGDTIFIRDSQGQLILNYIY